MIQICNKCQEYFKQNNTDTHDCTHIKKYGRCRKCYDTYWFDIPACHGGLEQCPVCKESKNLDEKHWELCGIMFSQEKHIYLS